MKPVITTERHPPIYGGAGWRNQRFRDRQPETRGCVCNTFFVKNGPRPILHGSFDRLCNVRTARFASQVTGIADANRHDHQHDSVRIIGDCLLIVNFKR
jgi:hypothetical protein